MTRNQIRITLLSGFALVAALTAPRPVAAQDAKQPYPSIAPIEQYLMDRDAEIALARSGRYLARRLSDRPNPSRLRDRGGR
jgi:hypothetical protein